MSEKKVVDKFYELSNFYNFEDKIKTDMAFTPNPQPESINGYSLVARSFKDGLDPIVASIVLAGPVTVEAVGSAIVSYVESVYYSGTTPEVEKEQLVSIFGNVYNAYISPKNGSSRYFSEQQRVFVRQILVGMDNLGVNENKWNNFFIVVNEGIASSGLSTRDQSALLMATAITKSAFTYFLAQCATPSADWATFLSADPATNYIELRIWMKAVFKGAIVGNTQGIPLSPGRPEAGVGVAKNIITTVTGALATTFGEITLNWVQKPTQRTTTPSNGIYMNGRT